MRLSRIPVWTLRAGLGFLACWLLLGPLGGAGFLPDVFDSTPQFEPVLLGLGIAFSLYGIAYHVAINMAHWREIREDDHQDKAVLCGRKRFERRKKLPPGLPARGYNPTEEEAGVFDALN